MGKHKPKEIKIIYEQVQGDPEETQRNLDHAYGILFDAMWEMYRTVKFPKRLGGWRGRTVYLLQAPDKAIYVYAEEAHRQLSNKAADVMRQHGTEESGEHTLDDFFFDSATSVQINDRGELLLTTPLLNHVGHKGRWKFTDAPNGLLLKRSA